MFQAIANASLRYLSIIARKAPFTVSTLLGLFSLILVWRIWRFTIRPIMRPDEPKELPYWIPFVGHAAAFFKDADGVLTYGREYFHNSREPFAITLAGERMIILTAPQDTAAAYKETVSLSFDPFVKDLFQTYGISSATIDKMYQIPQALNDATGGNAESRLQNENPLHKVLCHLQSDFYKLQLHPGEKLDDLGARFLRYIDENLQWDRLSPESNLPPTRLGLMHSGEKIVSLYRWSREVLVVSATKTFFGEKLLEIDPTFTQTFYDYDDESWKLLYKYPKIFARGVNVAKNKIVNVIEVYLNLPKEERRDASWIIQTLEAEQRGIGIDTRNIAAMMMLAYWVINANAHKLCFWLLTHILHTPSLHAALLAETSPTIHLSGSNIDMPYLLSSCPLLDSSYNEVLRLTDSAASIRSVESPTVIGGKLLRRGNKILCPFRQLHFDESVFGPNPATFDPERFMRSDKDLARSKSFRPFGGGTTYCPGRFVARQEVYMFVVVVLHRFRIEVMGGEGDTEGVNEEAEKTKEEKINPKKETPPTKKSPRLPELDHKKPSLGIMGPIKGADVLLRVRMRESRRDADEIS